MSSSSRRFSLTKSLSSVFSSSSTVEEKKFDDENIPTFLTSDLGPRVASILDQYADNIHDDSFLKIVRQHEFWHADQNLPEEEFVTLAERLARIASWRADLEDDSVAEKFKIPKVRFGRTELQMPIVTCGGVYLCQMLCLPPPDLNALAFAIIPRRRCLGALNFKRKHTSCSSDLS